MISSIGVKSAPSQRAAELFQDARTSRLGDNYLANPIIKTKAKEG